MIFDLIYRAKITPLFWGGPGQGKSSRVLAYAKARGIQAVILTASREDPAALAGYLYVQDGETRRAPRQWLRAVNEAAQKDGAALLFLDEITTAPPAVQAGLLSLITERQVDEVGLHPAVRIWAAGNSPSVAPGGTELAFPLANRFCHIAWSEVYPLDQALRDMAVGFPMEADGDKFFREPDDGVARELHRVLLPKLLEEPGRWFWESDEAPETFGQGTHKYAVMTRRTYWQCLRVVSCLREEAWDNPQAREAVALVCGGLIGHEKFRLLAQELWAEGIPTVHEILNGAEWPRSAPACAILVRRLRSLAEKKDIDQQTWRQVVAALDRLVNSRPEARASALSHARAIIEAGVRHMWPAPDCLKAGFWKDFLQAAKGGASL